MVILPRISVVIFPRIPEALYTEVTYLRNGLDLCAWSRNDAGVAKNDGDRAMGEAENEVDDGEEQADASGVERPPPLDAVLPRGTPRPPHPFFPVGSVPGDRAIVDLTFQRRPYDRHGRRGPLEHCPLEYRAEDFVSWKDVVELWGGGEYKVVGKDSAHRVVAYAPKSQDGW